MDIRNPPAIPVSGPGYLVYTALLTQTGTDAPVATVLQNTLTVATGWSYEEVGKYKFTSGDSLFYPGKVVIFLTADPAKVPHVLNVDANSDTTSISVLSFQEVAGILTATDGVMLQDSIEIRVYP